jgi:hypothetical protein
MAIVLTDDKHYKAIANVIRDKLDSGDTFLPEFLADNVENVYEAGVANGGKAECDVFWDAFQWNGTRTTYENAFKSNNWNNDSFKPKYDIVPVGDYDASNMFNESGITDIVYCLERQGISLDFSKASRMDNTFMRCQSRSLPQIDAGKLTRLNMTFYNMANLESISIINLSPSCTFTNTITYCYKLTDVFITGTIGQTGLSFQSAPLTKASLTNIVNVLSTTTSGLTVTLPLAAVKKQFETTPGANDGNTSAEWLALAGTRSNWTITLS